MKKWIGILLWIMYASFACAQSDSAKVFRVQAYGELYYSYDGREPENHEKPSFIYNHKRHNELNLNLAYLKGSYDDGSIRANIAFMAGTYARYNLASEPGWAQFVFEANAGFKLSKKKSLWFDAGIMPSHIGFESAVGSDCWTLTRSLVAENSPYYETGARLSYTTTNNKLYTAIMVLNGWQHIQRPDYIQRPSLGLQLTHKPTNDLTLNYSNFVGSDQADSAKAIRHYHNLYLQYQMFTSLGLTAGLDYGVDKYTPVKYGHWLAPVVMLRYSFCKRWFMTARGEYFHDPQQVIVKTGSPNGLQVWGYSLNLDYQIRPHLMIRAEGKRFNAQRPVFSDAGVFVTNNSNLTLAMCVRL
ncbi:MAG: porin [Chitinophagaceae bacterium]|nr:porin [Chitinophagaceae bacterium]